MLYPKFSQRYLAAIVCCLILLLGISTLVLTYSLYIRRSPLLVKNLQNAIVSGQLKNNRIFNAKIIHSQKAFNGSIEQNTIDIRKYPSNKSHGINQQSNVSDMKGQKNKTSTESDLDESNYSDTIYIDDFERNKTNIFTSENPISEDISARYAQGHHSQLIPTLIDDERTSSPAEISVSAGNLNLDSVYDRSRGSDESLEFSEDGADDLSTGSGSGDFDETSFIDDELTEYDNSATKYFSKDFKDYDTKLQLKSQKNYDRSLQIEKKRNKSASENTANVTKDDNKSKTTKLKKKMRPIIQKSSSHFADRHFVRNYIEKLPKSEKRRMKNRLAKSSKDRLDLVSSSVKDGIKLKHNNNKRNKNKETIPLSTTATITTKTTAADSLVSKRKLLKSKLRFRENNDDKLSDEGAQFQKPTAMKSNSSPTWVETRPRLLASRRILGNARKSEERSRQLLLCEEAGGGELCQMLFKGHTSE